MAWVLRGGSPELLYPKRQVVKHHLISNPVVGKKKWLYHLLRWRQRRFLSERWKIFKDWKVPQRETILWQNKTIKQTTTKTQGKYVPVKLSQGKLKLKFSYLRLRDFLFSVFPFLSSLHTLYFYSFYILFPVFTFVFPTSFLAKLLLKDSRPVCWTRGICLYLSQHS